MDVLLESLHNYYSVEKNMNKLLDVVEVNNKISLRIIDWFVTNYSKKNNIFYTIYITPDGEKSFESEGNKVLKQFTTYHSYKSQLKSYSKKSLIHFVGGRE